MLIIRTALNSKYDDYDDDDAEDNREKMGRIITERNTRRGDYRREATIGDNYHSRLRKTIL
jgi:hypothetical protein